MAHRRRPRARDARPVHPPRHRALARLDRRRLPRLPLSRLALRRVGRLRAHSAVGHRHHSSQGAHAGVSVPGTLRPRLGLPGRGRAGLRAARGSGAGIRRLEGGEHRAVRLEERRLAAGGELHRLRPLPVGASRAARRSRAAGRARPQGGHRRARAALHDRASRGAQQRRLPGVRQHRHRAARAAQPLRAAPALHDRAAPGLGRREGHGLLLRLAARDARALPRLLHHRPQLRPRRPRLARCRSSSA